MIVLAVLAAAGAFAGFLAGLLGVGGGIVLVPAMLYALPHLGVEDPMHTAIATSLATIIATGMSSAYAHHKRQSVDYGLLKRWAVGSAFGAFAGALFATRLDGDTLRYIFAAVLPLLAAAMAFDFAKWAGEHAQNRPLPGTPVLSVIGFFTAFVSSLAGIGGATLNVPAMRFMGVPIHRSIGTASATGIVIAIAATAGFCVAGLAARSGMPISLIAFIVIAPASMLFAPLGAKAAHALPVKPLRRVFAVFMVLVALNLVFG